MALEEHEKEVEDREADYHRECPIDDPALTTFDADAQEEDGDRKADENCGYGVEEFAKPPVVKCFGYILGRDVNKMATCSIVNSGQ